MTNSSDLKTGGSDVEIRDPISEMGTIVPIQSAQNIELVPFDEVDSEPVKVRSRLRLTAIMCGLYVRLPS
jgi:hypothetical protein